MLCAPPPRKAAPVLHLTFPPGPINCLPLSPPQSIPNRAQVIRIFRNARGGKRRPRSWAIAFFLLLSRLHNGKSYSVPLKIPLPTERLDSREEKKKETETTSPAHSLHSHIIQLNSPFGFPAYPFSFGAPHLGPHLRSPLIWPVLFFFLALSFAQFPPSHPLPPAALHSALPLCFSG